MRRFVHLTATFAQGQAVPAGLWPWVIIRSGLDSSLGNALLVCLSGAVFGFRGAECLLAEARSGMQLLDLSGNGARTAVRPGD